MNKADKIKTYVKVLTILQKEIIEGSYISWADIVVKVKEQVSITNWMYVRSVLQDLINDGTVVRKQSVHVEEYTKVVK